MKKIIFSFSAALFLCVSPASGLTNSSTSNNDLYARINGGSVLPPSQDEEESPISCKTYYNKYLKTYTVTFYNKSRYSVQVSYYYHNGEKWQQNFVVVPANGSDGGYPAGPTGELREISWKWY